MLHTSSRFSPSLFTYCNGSTRVYALVYVDNIILAASSSQLIFDLISELNTKSALKQLVELDYFLGLEVKKTKSSSFVLSEAKYIKELLSRASMTNGNHINNLMISSCKLSNYGTDSLSKPHLYTI